MSTVALYLVVVFAAGALAAAVRLPPLIGFLAAGFVLNAMGTPEMPGLDRAADVGVTLMLFGIGLKLDVRSLLRKEVWGTAGIHMVLSSALAAGFLGLLALVHLELPGDTARALLLAGFALSFSSTVLVFKVLEERSETTSLYGRVAIGILVIQDVAAVAFITATSGHPPSPWAFALLLLLPGAWLFRRVWERLGHGELQALFGIVMALVPGYIAFTAVGLKGDLGALLVGALLASHPNASELSRRLFTVKDLLLVAFFVSIGFHGMPTTEMVLMGAALLALLPVQALLFVWLLWAFGLRRRTSLRAGLALANYSEFALIVGAIGVSTGMLVEDWLVMLSVAVALSFVVSTLVNRRGSALTGRLVRWLPEHPDHRLHPEDRPIDIGHAEVLVLGMGRVGQAAYREFAEEHGYTVVGIENSTDRVERLCAAGLDVQEADATDQEFWERVIATGHVRIAVLAMPFHGSNLVALEQLTAGGFSGAVAAVAQYDDEVQELRARGVRTVFNLYSGAGIALASETLESLGERDADG
ncbi:potassium transporter Kef [Kocuria flava]|uniref:Potassium transporter Kef n=1 Tax=Kocuria flava TaxID=446860 RepID=A0A0U3HSN4_9MICC|nr:cation:proton antiporter family protein [Kocuria flava]ALU40582.1 potassium transporter Kef [Kocuria flava]GEO92734.1 potassium transporter Kef [Kocuria flava]